MLIKNGTTLEAPAFVATSTTGFPNGLVPPTVGCAWQLAQLSELNRGPSPLPVPGIVPLTESTSWKASKPASKNLLSLTVKPGIAAPAPGAPPRTPGSVAVNWASSITAIPATKSATKENITFVFVNISPPFVSFSNVPSLDKAWGRGQ